MSELRAPSEAEVREAIRRITTPQFRRMFFERLKNPHWLEPLAKEGLFDSPPEPEATSDGLIRDFYWPEIDYLIRVAPAKPNRVVDILLDLEATNNPWVRRAVFTIGASIPAAEAARLKPLLKSWLVSGFGWRTDPREMVDYAVNLLAGGQRKAGRWVANLLFRPRPPHGEASAAPALEDYWYVDGLPKVVAAIGQDGLRVVLPWLVEYERLHGNRTDSYDMTYLGRESIRRASGGVGGHRSVEQALIDAVRDLTVNAVRDDPERVIALLVGSDMILGRKIALFAVAEALRSPDGTTAEVEGLLETASSLLWDAESKEDACRIEFGELARAVASKSSGLLEPLADFLAAGPVIGMDTLRDRLNRDPDGDRQDLERQVAAYIDGWKHRWLGAVGEDALPADLKPVLAELDARLGPIEGPLEPTARITSWVGPSSPLTQEEMAAKSASELVAHLESWHDMGDGWGPEPTHEGQGRQLTALVTTNPMAVSGVGNIVGRLRPTYLGAVLRGWDAALKAGLALNWSQVAEVVQGVLRHPDESEFPVEGGDWDEDPDYRSAKHAAVRLLENLVSRREESIVPVGSLVTYAELLLTDANDEVAWTEYAGASRESEMDPLSLSINWQWPIRLRGLLNLLSHGSETAWYGRAKTALESELARADERGASAAVIGEGLGRLLNADPNWIEPKIADLFGGQEGLTRNQQIALTTAMAVHHYHRKLYSLLSPAMTAAIGLGDGIVAGWNHTTDPLQTIGEWVVSAFIHGHASLDDPVADAFFSGTSPDVRGKALGHIAWSFFHAQAVDNVIRDRFADLWDLRIDHVRSHPEDAHELNDFHWVVKCGKFSVSWWLPRLSEGVELDPDLARERYMIGKEIASAAETDPARALAALKALMVHRGEAGLPAWDLSRNAVPIVIARAMTAGDESLRGDAIAFMNHLGEQGNIDLEQQVNDALSGKISQDDVRSNSQDLWMGLFRRLSRR